MPETNTENTNVAPPPEAGEPDWDALAKTLKIGSAEEAKKRAYEIAAFVGKVDNDSNSELILKRGGKKIALTLKK